MPETKNISRLGILYHPHMEGRALALAKRIAQKIDSRGIPNWLCSAWEEEKARSLSSDSSLIISIGGDGTVLRAARAAAAHSVPLLSINMGKLGFMTELEATEAIDKLDFYLFGDNIWKDERAMIKSTVIRKGLAKEEFHALNDVLLTRGNLPRVIQVKAIINDEDFTTYRGDGILIATATGSTGYSLSLGGSILHPQSRDLLMKAVSPHLSFSTAVILPGDTIITLELCSDLQSVASIDGQIDLELKRGDQVVVQISPLKTCFLRLNPPSFFYKTLVKKLSFKE